MAAAALVLAVGCQELPNYFVGDETLARVGRTELTVRDVLSAVPAGMNEADSTAFVDLYVDRWVRKQLKLGEAERLFTASAEDIDRMVEEYRQALLIRKLDRFWVDRSIDTTFTDDEIAAYYREHLDDFRLDRTLVKGRVLRFDEGFRQAKRLFEWMGSPSAERQKDFADLCAKHNFPLTDFGGAWVDFQEFLSYLPALRSQNYDSVLDRRGVQQMRDGRSHYYYRIDAALRPGDPVPLETVRGQIRRILFTQRQNELIRAREQELYDAAAVEGGFRIYGHDKTER